MILSERFFRRKHGSLTTLPLRADGDIPVVQRTAFPRTGAEIAVSQASRDERRALYEDVQRRRRSGQMITQIAQALA